MVKAQSGSCKRMRKMLTDSRVKARIIENYSRRCPLGIHVRLFHLLDCIPHLWKYFTIRFVTYAWPINSQISYALVMLSYALCSFHGLLTAALFKNERPIQSLFCLIANISLEVRRFCIRTDSDRESDVAYQVINMQMLPGGLVQLFGSVDAQIFVATDERERS